MTLSNSNVLNCIIDNISDSGACININSNKLGDIDVGDIIKYEFHNENGYYDIENKVSVYKGLEHDENFNSSQYKDNIFTCNAAISSFPKTKIKEISSQDNTDVKHCISVKPMENIKEKPKVNSTYAGYYESLSTDVILKDVAKLNDTQITIVKMYKEIMDLRKKLENSN